MKPAIYQLRELVTEQDPMRRMKALLEWEKRWVKELHVATYVDRPSMMQATNPDALRRHLDERAAAQMGAEVAKVAERQETAWDAGADRILLSVQVLTDKDPDARATSEENPK